MRLAELTDSHAEGTLQISERAVNEVLSLMVERSTQPTIEMLPRNMVMIRFGVFHARAELPKTAAGDVSRITVRMASLLVAMGLKALVHVPFVEIHGRQLTVDLAAVPAMEPWRDLWKHLLRLTFETIPGGLRVGFRLHIEEPA